jgi:hypothetical protein
MERLTAFASRGLATGDGKMCFYSNVFIGFVGFGFTSLYLSNLCLYVVMAVNFVEFGTKAPTT